MSSAIYPPIPPHQLLQEEETSRQAELTWLLELLQDNLDSLKSGLQECLDLLEPTEPGTTLVISSLRSESVKGFVTRVGTEIVRGDIRINLPSLPPPSHLPSTTTISSTLTSAFTTHPTPSFTTLRISAPLPPPQPHHPRTTLSSALALLPPLPSLPPAQILAQLRLLAQTLHSASVVLNGGPLSSPSTFSLSEGEREEEDEDDNAIQIPGLRWDDAAPPSSSTTTTSTRSPPSAATSTATAFHPLPPTLSPHLALASGALTLTLRTLAPSSSSSPNPSTTSSSAFDLTTTFRQRLGLGTKPLPVHEESGQSFWYGAREVVVRERVRVESSLDPGVIALGAKVGVLGREVGGWAGRVGAVLGE